VTTVLEGRKAFFEDLDVDVFGYRIGSSVSVAQCTQCERCKLDIVYRMDKEISSDSQISKPMKNEHKHIDVSHGCLTMRKIHKPAKKYANGHAIKISRISQRSE
jgi:BRCT domain type II-containing protein